MPSVRKKESDAEVNPAEFLGIVSNGNTEIATLGWTEYSFALCEALCYLLSSGTA